MGRSQENNYVPNPAKHSLQWSGSEGVFYSYDVNKRERVNLELPLRFAWVESLSTITGYNEPDGFFIRANEIKDLKSEALNVHHYVTEGSGDNAKSKRVNDFSGLYIEIKDQVKSKSYGGRFTTVVYAVADGDNGPVKSGDIIRIEIAGAALNAWIDKGFNHYDGGVAVYEAAPKKKGAVDYFQPIFKQESIGPEVDESAKNADTLVNNWVEQKASSSSVPEDSDEGPDEDVPPDFDDYEDDIPF